MPPHGRGGHGHGGHDRSWPWGGRGSTWYTPWYYGYIHNGYEWPQNGLPDHEYVGLSLQEAAELANHDGLILRVVTENGVVLQRTYDVIYRRVNVAVSNGYVTAVYARG